MDLQIKLPNGTIIQGFEDEAQVLRLANEQTSSDTPKPKELNLDTDTPRTYNGWSDKENIFFLKHLDRGISFLKKAKYLTNQHKEKQITQRYYTITSPTYANYVSKEFARMIKKYRAGKDWQNVKLIKSSNVPKKMGKRVLWTEKEIDFMKKNLDKKASSFAESFLSERHTKAAIKKKVGEVKKASKEKVSPVQPTTSLVEEKKYW